MTEAKVNRTERERRGGGAATDESRKVNRRVSVRTDEGRKSTGGKERAEEEGEREMRAIILFCHEGTFLRTYDGY